MPIERVVAMLILATVLTLSSCGTPRYVDNKPTSPAVFFAELNQYGERLDHELVRTNGSIVKGTNISCDQRICWWDNNHMQEDSLLVDSILAIRFHSRLDAFERSFLSYLQTGFLCGAGLAFLAHGLDYMAPQKDVTPADLLAPAAIGALAGGVLGLAVVLTDGQSLKDPGYTFFVFRKATTEMQELNPPRNKKRKR